MICILVFMSRIDMFYDVLSELGIKVEEVYEAGAVVL